MEYRRNDRQRMTDALREKYCPSATFSTTNVTWIGQNDRSRWSTVRK